MSDLENDNLISLEEPDRRNFLKQAAVSVLAGISCTALGAETPGFQRLRDAVSRAGVQYGVRVFQ